MPKRQIGIVRWLDKNEGYGFIACKRGEDVYFHYDAIVCGGKDCGLEEGDPVEFTTVEGEDGAQAQDVVLLKSAKFE